MTEVEPQFYPPKLSCVILFWLAAAVLTAILVGLLLLLIRWVK